jgi:hypothetical protein
MVARGTKRLGLLAQPERAKRSDALGKPAATPATSTRQKNRSPRRPDYAGRRVRNVVQGQRE